MPWANGRGETLEVARGGSNSPTSPASPTSQISPTSRSSPSAAGAAPWQWRVSIATVEEPGPFSSLPGIDRLIAVVSGAGMVLTVDGVDEVVEFGRPFAFSGDATTSARLLDGAVRDLNVMTARGPFAGSLTISPPVGAAMIAARSGGFRCLVAVGQEPTVVRIEDESIELEPLDAVLDVRAPVVVTSGRIAMIDVVEADSQLGRSPDGGSARTSRHGGA